MAFGGGGGGQTSQTGSKAVTWQQLLPPWVQQGQKEFMPYLFQRAYAGGMLPEEESLLKGMNRAEVYGTADASKRALGQRMAASGLSPSSPSYAGAFGDIEAGKVSGMAQSMANLAKVKMGAGETARQQLLTALYTPPPYTTRQFGSSSSGGGK